MTNIKRILCLVLVLCMIVAGSVTALADQMSASDGSNTEIAGEAVPLAAVYMSFADVPDTAWYRDAVAYVYAAGLMTGESADAFDPTGTTTRGQLATILWRLVGEPTEAGTHNFADVPAGAYYAEAVAWAAADGIMIGYGGGIFGVDDNITREQLATVMYRYARFSGYDVSAEADLSSYSDAEKISSYARAAMVWSVGSGLISGISDTLLDPAGNASRAQLATILMRFCQTIAAIDISDPDTPLSDGIDGISGRVDYEDSDWEYDSGARFIGYITAGGVTSYFASLEDAIANANDGSVIYLLQNAALSRLLIIPNGISITIIGSGKTIRGNIRVDGALRLENVTVAGNITVSAGGSLILGNGAVVAGDISVGDNGTLNIESGACVKGSITLGKNVSQTISDNASISGKIGTLQEIVEELNRIARETSITISMNLNIVMESGEAEANLRIENDPDNSFAQVVQLTKEDTGEIIYTSDIIPVGEYISRAPLDVTLPAGDYRCIARFSSVTDDGAPVGAAQANVRITVLS